MQNNQRTLKKWYKAFLLDRRVRQVSPNTIRFYKQKLDPFVEWCAREGVFDIEDITPNHLRLFLVYLQDRGNNAGGRHGFYRGIRALLTFYELETEAEDDGWRNPIKKVSPPKVPQRPIDPVPIEDVQKLIATCDHNTFYGSRDKAIFMVLLDTGVRASELTSINLEDVDLISGSIQIRKAKGNKVRTIFIGKRCKKSVRIWLRKRPREAEALFTTQKGNPITYSGLRQILRRKSLKSNVTGASLHDFRRAFCLFHLQNGTAETILARYLGHSDTSLIATYAKQTTAHLQSVYHSIGDSEL